MRLVMSVIWLWQEIVLWWEIGFKMRTSFDFLWAVSTKKSYWVPLLWSYSQCMYFVRPNTLLLCIFLFWIFLLYRTDPQVEVHIRIILKKAAIMSKCKHRQSHFDFPNTDSKKNSTWVSLLKRNNLLAKLCFSWNLSIGCLPKFDFPCVCAFFSRIFVWEFFF